MYKKKKILAIIAARSGSKSIRDKNLSKINGKTLLEWIISKALNSKYIDKIYVSTDSFKYKKLSNRYGAYCPTLRPKNISGGNSTEIEYIFHTLNVLKEKNFYPDYVVRLQPTSPFQTTNDIDNSIKKIVNNKNATSLQVVSESSQSPLKALQLYNKKYLKPYFYTMSNNEVLNRQKLKKSYYRSNIIISKTKNILKNKTQIGKRSLIYLIPSNRSIDINDRYDLEVAKMINKKFGFLKNV